MNRLTEEDDDGFDQVKSDLERLQEVMIKSPEMRTDYDIDLIESLVEVSRVTLMDSGKFVFGTIQGYPQSQGTMQRNDLKMLQRT
jgi:hypothetical protein